MVNIINVICVCVHVFPVIYICTLWTLCSFLCLPYYCSHLEIVFVWASILRSSPIHSNDQYFLFFFYTLGSALVKCGETEKKIGQAGRELKAKSMTNFLHQLKTFLEGDMKTIAVSTLTFYICTVVLFYNDYTNMLILQCCYWNSTITFRESLLNIKG